MCGIHAAIYTAGACPPTSPALARRLRSRGPDHQGTVSVSVSVTTGLDHGGGGGATTLALSSTVLSLRGRVVARQPLVDQGTGSVLCWNGEAWRIGGREVRGNDAEALLGLLSGAGGGGAAPDDGGRGVLRVLRGVEGPFAFVYYDGAARRVFYGRDRLGRRSLLVRGGDPFVLASVADGGGWAEVEADGVHVLQLPREADVDGRRGGGPRPGERVPVRHDWVDDGSYVRFVVGAPFGVSRVWSQTRRCRLGFITGTASFTKSSCSSLLPPCLFSPEGNRGQISGIGPFNRAMPPPGHHPLTRRSGVVEQLRRRLAESLRLRVLRVPVPPGATEAAAARVAVLFSGGLDCTVLARLASHVLPGEQPIDLLNVAFENPRIAGQHKGVPREELYELCPDRVTGRRSFAELARVCPGRRFRLVTINIPFALTAKHRSEVVALMYPHETEMDLSIACALYFAARGDGLCQTRVDATPTPYRTTARVLLSGLGADELFGGYTRHATAYRRRGYEGLVEELELDVSRLGKRNLGRDDRVMAHWEKEVRFPYLDEGVVRWAMGLPVWEKCDFGSGDGEDGPEPGKRILRLLAEELGLGGVAREKKRAIQFGARTAKMESGRVKGTAVVSA